MGRQSRLKAERRAWRAQEQRSMLSQCGQKDAQGKRCIFPAEWEGLLPDESAAGPGVMQVREKKVRACELHKVQAEVMGVGRAWVPIHGTLAGEIYKTLEARMKSRAGSTPVKGGQAQPAPVD
jgi:hypothetical protein